MGKKKYPRYDSSDGTALRLAGTHKKELEAEAGALIKALGLESGLLANVTHALCSIFLAEKGIRNLQLPRSELLAEAQKQTEGINAAVLTKALGLNMNRAAEVGLVWRQVRSGRDWSIGKENPSTEEGNQDAGRRKASRSYWAILRDRANAGDRVAAERLERLRDYNRSAQERWRKEHPERYAEQLQAMTAARKARPEDPEHLRQRRHKYWVRLKEREAMGEPAALRSRETRRRLERERRLRQRNARQHSSDD